MRCFALLALVSVATLGTSTALVEAGEVTTITVEANNCYMPSWIGGTTYACTPENTLDGSIAAISRWSCKDEQVEDENCRITYFFSEPQDIVTMRIAFHKGDENKRWLKVKLNGNTYSTIESSGDTLSYQTFTLKSDETEKLSLEAVGLDDDEWISITEVRFRVI